MCLKIVVLAKKESSKSSRHLGELPCSVALRPRGTPALIPAIGAVQTQEQLTELGKHLPAECAGALFWLSEGMPVDEVREGISVPQPKKVDTQDFSAALENPDTRRRFARIESDHDLQAMLNAPFEKWRVRADSALCLFDCQPHGRASHHLPRTRIAMPGRKQPDIRRARKTASSLASAREIPAVLGFDVNPEVIAGRVLEILFYADVPFRRLN